jgi:GntR family transcriptional regulator, carbon starvation induced regulator
MNKPTSVPKTLADQVYKALREDIIHDKFKPGVKLRIELLKKTYNVGATPLREALYRLSSDGFVEAHGQRGFRVEGISLNELMDITNLRVTLESMALSLSIKNGNDEWESRVVAAFHHLSKAENQPETDIQELERKNHDFHLALISCCNSPWLMRFYETLYDQHKRYRNIARLEKLSKRDVRSEHKAIYDAALARDADTLCKANSDHIRRTADITSQILAEDTVPMRKVKTG